MPRAINQRKFVSFEVTMKSLRICFELGTALPALQQHSSGEARGARTVKCAHPPALHTRRCGRRMQARAATPPRLRVCCGAPCPLHRKSWRTVRKLALAHVAHLARWPGPGGLEPAMPRARQRLHTFTFRSLLRSRRGISSALAAPVSFRMHRFYMHRCMRR